MLEVVKNFLVTFLYRICNICFSVGLPLKGLHAFQAEFLSTFKIS